MIIPIAIIIILAAILHFVTILGHGPIANWSCSYRQNNPGKAKKVGLIIIIACVVIFCLIIFSLLGNQDFTKIRIIILLSLAALDSIILSVGYYLRTGIWRSFWQRQDTSLK